MLVNYQNTKWSRNARKSLGAKLLHLSTLSVIWSIPKSTNSLKAFFLADYREGILNSPCHITTPHRLTTYNWRITLQEQIRISSYLVFGSSTLCFHSRTLWICSLVNPWLSPRISKRPCSSLTRSLLATANRFSPSILLKYNSSAAFSLFFHERPIVMTREETWSC